MKCNKCGKELKYVNTGKVITNVQDCKCGSITLMIPKHLYIDIDNIVCENCGEYPFEKQPDAIEEVVKITFIKEEEIQL